MARALVLGNGNVLVCYDQCGQVRDFYFPSVGQENHVGERLTHKVGVFVDGTLHWLSDEAFAITVTYDKETLVALVSAVNKTLGVTLTFSDVVYNEHDIYIRRVTVRNDRRAERIIKLFFNQQFHISESSHGDTGYYSPELHAVIHYKGRRMFLASLLSDGDFFDDYSIGLLGIEGKEGTWRDAEDGVLSKSAIEHGSVDSVIAKELTVAGESSVEATYWLAVGTTYRRVAEAHRDILARTGTHLFETTRSYWHAWVNRRDLSTCGLDEELVGLYKQSLLVIRTHCDNQGAIIASGDSSILQNGRDTYSYCWPRDGAYVSQAFLHAGYLRAPARFHTFCDDVLTDDGYLLHKYRPDKSLGSSWHPWVHRGRAQPPIQEDETALTLVTLLKQYELGRDIEFVEAIFNSYIKKTADFLTKYRDKRTGLPLPSHGLWEERYGVFTYTAACVYTGLAAAAQFADLLGKPTAAGRWRKAADEVKHGILTELVRDDGTVLKSIDYSGQEPVPDATLDASAFYGLFAFSVLPVDDSRLINLYERVKRELSSKNGIGGIARYVGDEYYRDGDAAPGNPWVITTLWLADYEIAKAKDAQELAPALERLRWVAARANGAGLLAEQYEPGTGAPRSVTPLIWSHAGYITTFLSYVQKMKDLGVCPTA